MNFLTQFFKALDFQSIQYCVLRNYEQLPITTGNSDLDILINKKDSRCFINLVKELANHHNGKIISVIDSAICPRICVLGNKEVGWGIMIDLHYDLISYCGHTLLSNKIVWKNTFLFNETIYALNNDADSLNGLLKELLNNKTCNEKYFYDFKNSSIDEVFLKEVFYDINKPELISALLNFKNENYTKKTITSFIKILNVSFPRKKLESLKKYFKLTRLFKQPGFTIAFLGTDGSGKSTIIDSISPILNQAFHKAVYYEHMRPNKLPSISRLLGNKEEFDAPVTNPHGSSVSGFFGSLLRWLYYACDYTFGFYLKVWPKKAIRTCVWIFDRYYYDYLIDPKRGRIKLPKWILKLGQFIIPEPDLILCLGTDAATIHKRKPELTPKEVERQVLELRAFCDSHKKAVWIDTGKNIETSSNDALEIIIEMMSKRFEKKY